MAKDKTTTKVTRIKANDNGSKKAVKQSNTAVKPARSKSKADKQPSDIDKTKADLKSSPEKKKNIFARIKDYFAGAWFELRQVRWPDRKSTWSMTGALLLFTAMFVIFILLIDALFRYIFELIII